MRERNLMIVGTSSGAGKSITVAGLCRVFKQAGYKVTPFKSQNMALNSFITKKGDEIGRAQAIQAIAAGIEADYRMNPILLKPTGDRRIQVILNGKSIGNMSGTEYSEKKNELKKDILKAYNELIKDKDICVIEGAGSPVEINLTENDIVNMGLAKMLDAPVILVADIDRGGVFASIYGTIALMKEEERERVKGIIINKFRGDIEILRPGLEKIEKLIEKPILGVIPHFNLDIEDEDGVTDRFTRKKRKGSIKISVIKLKHISNFTDLNALELEEDVEINYITSKEELGDEDLIVIPGSKNTIDDIVDLNKKEITSEILKLSRRNIPIVGICGGFQILGQKVKDPYGIEGEIKEVPGLGLLNIETIMNREKKTTQFKESLKFGGDIFENLELEVEGYEIHQGETKVLNSKEKLIAYGENRVLGTYIHGIFDNTEFRKKLLNSIRSYKGLEEKKESFDYKKHREKELDKLSDILKENLDIERIYKILEGE